MCCDPRFAFRLYSSLLALFFLFEVILPAGAEVGDEAEDDGAPSGSARDNCVLSHTTGKLLKRNE